MRVRYYLTNDFPNPKGDIYYSLHGAVENFPGVAATLKSVAGSTSDNGYIELSFGGSSGSLAVNDVAMVQVGFYASSVDAQHNQSKDYSYAPAASGTTAGMGRMHGFLLRRPIRKLRHHRVPEWRAHLGDSAVTAFR